MAAAKKKPKAKVKRKKAPAGKPAIRKKSKPLKKPAAKKPAKRAAPKPAARSPSKTRATPARPAPKPAAVAPARPEPLPGEELIGFVTHYYGHLSVAAIRLESGSLSVGDTIRVLGHTSDFRQRVESMQIEHQAVTEAGRRQEIGLKVTEHARENDLVYKVTA
ncbi:MAG TPA: EF-Tu/IF-2/RF-3 family GTPase [Burkholderiales bacterium]|nr:EF-Tu/IF-2/RF-3 family GTPase [Burkholderiales bacterium]